MKKYNITLLALLFCQILTAQTDGCLIVKEYSPDEWSLFTKLPSTIKIY